MLDAAGRPIKVGDMVAHIYDNDDLIFLPHRIKNAVLGQVVEIAEDFQGEFISLGDGIIYGTEDIITLGGLKEVTCPECGRSWEFDVRMNIQEECQDCDYLLVVGECQNF